MLLLSAGLLNISFFSRTLFLLLLSSSKYTEAKIASANNFSDIKMSRLLDTKRSRYFSK